MFDVILYEPEIPANTGNIIRLCANTGCRLHLVEPLGYAMDDKRLRRAGLDYHEYARVQCHPDINACLAALEVSGEGSAGRLFAFTTKGGRSYHRVAYRPGDALLFGPESRGLPEAVRGMLPAEHRLRLPMRQGSRSLNLSNCVAVAVYEAWRQQDYAGEVGE